MSSRKKSAPARSNLRSGKAAVPVRTNVSPVGAVQEQPPVQGTVQFVQHNLPGLEAGEYMLEVTQTASTQATSPIQNRYFFAVVGERFTINPADVDVTYPPDQSSGEYDNTLPHVVLKKQTLPWLRFPTVDAPPYEYPDGQHDRDVPTWLAVLLFDEDDIAAHPGFDPQATTVALADLFIPRPAPSGPQGYSYFFRAPQLGPSSDASELAKHLDYGQHPTDHCQVIDVPMQLFFAIAPSVDDLKLLAHVRNVDISKKATQNGVPASRNELSKIPGTSDYALVLGNRMPKSGKRTFAHLVSLEGLAPFLPIDAAQTDSPNDVSVPTSVDANPAFTIAPDGYMRLVSLVSWSFHSTGDGRAFERLLLGLAPKNPIAGGGGDYSIGLPAPAVASSDPASLREAKNALAMGYTALEHHTRDGGKTVSWYRGPLLPYPVTGTRGLPTYSSADAATSLNPDTGMLDVSYAVAWQIGRLLALQNKQFSVALYNWRRSNLRDVVTTMEKLIARQSLDAIQKQLRDESLICPLLEVFLPDAPNVGAATAQLVAQDPAVRADARTVLREPSQIIAALGDSLAVPLEIYTWLAKLKLLDGVPFRYLVPDERMLPPESMRIFYVDMNWVHALIDGALSIGRNVARQSPSAEQAHDLAVAPALLAALDGHARKVRALALGLSPSPSAAPVEQVSGFLLRGAIVDGWPGLEVNGYADDETGTLMDIVRFERLAPTVMICMFEKDNKLVRNIDVHEPAEGLHFGVTDDSPASINIRYNVQHGDDGPGHQVVGVDQPVPFRGTEERRVVRVYRLAKQLDDPKYAAYIQNISKDYDHLPSSEFAMQLVKGVGLVSFNHLPGSGS